MCLFSKRVIFVSVTPYRKTFNLTKHNGFKMGIQVRGRYSEQ